MTQDSKQAIKGICAEEFASLGDELTRRLDNDAELGASIAVAVDGELVVDLWGGWADRARTTAWNSDTLVCVFSCTKPVVALAALMLARDGRLDLDAPVADYWPEFAANGKQNVLVRHLLAHTSGVSGWDHPITLPDVYDWDTSTARLATQEPWWEPGSASGYHAISYGHLIGEVIRRITGLIPGEYIRRHICEPISADFHLGLAPAHHSRVAQLITVPPPSLDGLPTDSVPARTFTGPRLDDPGEFESAQFRIADIGAANGHCTARALATITSPIAAGDFPRALEMQADGIDLALGVPLRWGLGLALPQPQTFPFIPDRRIGFWFGAGGSFVLADLDRGISAAYVMNRLHEGIYSANTIAYLTPIFAAFGYSKPDRGEL